MGKRRWKKWLCIGDLSASGFSPTPRLHEPHFASLHVWTVAFSNVNWVFDGLDFLINEHSVISLRLVCIKTSRLIGGERHLHDCESSDGRSRSEREEIFRDNQINNSTRLESWNHEHKSANFRCRKKDLIKYHQRLTKYEKKGRRILRDYKLTEQESSEGNVQHTRGAWCAENEIRAKLYTTHTKMVRLTVRVTTFDNILTVWVYSGILCTKNSNAKNSLLLFAKNKNKTNGRSALQRELR